MFICVRHNVLTVVLSHKNLQLLLGMRSSNKHLEHGHPPFLFSYDKFQWTKFERKLIVTFISEELP